MSDVQAINHSQGKTCNLHAGADWEMPTIIHTNETTAQSAATEVITTGNPVTQGGIKIALTACQTIGYWASHVTDAVLTRHTEGRRWLIFINSQTHHV